MRTKLSICVFVLAAVLIGPGTHAEVTEATVTVKGVACPFCVYGIEKKLKQVPGIEGIEYDLESGKGQLKFDEDKPLDIRAVREAIKKAGFTLEKVELTVTGTLAEKDEHIALIARKTSQRFVLFEPNEEHGWLSEKTRDQLESLLPRFLGQIEQVLQSRFAEHRIKTDWVFINVPPAWVQHLRKDLSDTHRLPENAGQSPDTLSKPTRKK